MKTTRLYSIGLVAVMVFTFSQQSFAQWDFYKNPGYINTINTAMSNSVMQNAVKNGNSDGSNSTSPAQSSISEVVPAYRRYQSVQFKSTGTRLSVKKAAELLDPVPADRPETEKMLSDILDKYEAAARAKGYPNDWALALVSYICLSSRVYHGNTEKPIIPFEQNVGLRDVIAEHATDNGIFKNVADRKKQELYEILVIFGGVAYQFYEKALQEKNPEKIEIWKRFAAQNLKDIGIKP